jgi:hypothetical protein
MLVASPPVVVTEPSGTLPARSKAAPRRLIPVAIAVEMRARFEVLRAWRIRSWTMSRSMGDMGFTVA